MVGHLPVRDDRRVRHRAVRPGRPGALDKVLHRVQDDAQDAEEMDLNSTPTLFVNGIRHKGPWDAASLIRALGEKRR